MCCSTMGFALLFGFDGPSRALESKSGIPNFIFHPLEHPTCFSFVINFLVPCLAALRRSKLKKGQIWLASRGGLDENDRQPSLFHLAFVHLIVSFQGG